MRHNLGLKFLFNRGRALLSHPVFWFLTGLANLIMAGGAFITFWFEAGANPRMTTFMDALWWSVSTVTTVGYGDITPITNNGRIAGMALMIFGTATFGAFTALFATVLLEPDILEVEDEVRGLKKKR